jgi:hypothetical protein
LTPAAARASIIPAQRKSTLKRGTGGREAREMNFLGSRLFRRAGLNPMEARRPPLALSPPGGGPEASACQYRSVSVYDRCKALYEGLYCGKG